MEELKDAAISGFILGVCAGMIVSIIILKIIEWAKLKTFIKN